MLLWWLIILPLLGIFFTTLTNNHNEQKNIVLTFSLVNFFVSIIMFILFEESNADYQFVQEIFKVDETNFYIGVDGISVYFVLLTTLIIPIVIFSNFFSIEHNIRFFYILILILETLLILVFIVLDTFLFYIFFESTLIPLFLLIGIYGSKDKVRASFYLFLYTLAGSLLLLLAILYIWSTIGATGFNTLYKSNISFYGQLLIFIGTFIAFSVKTPVIFLNNWLLKAHVESPLGGSVILAAIVLKLSLYGIYRILLSIVPKACLYFSSLIFVIGVITIIYASISTLRTIDIKELIAYSSVSHAAVYLLSAFSNTIYGIQGSIILGLAHGFVSSGLFICVGGILYDRTHTRLITIYKGITQIMPIFSLLFFILCLSNAGTPLSLNFIGEFLSLYGIFEKTPILAIFACSSIVLSAGYTIYMYNRVAFGGNYSRFFNINIIDLKKREFLVILILVCYTIILGIYPVPILNVLNYSTSELIYFT
jgi:NADH-ubiquinone oxidoreductase chain 4